MNDATPTRGSTSTASSGPGASAGLGGAGLGSGDGSPEVDENALHLASSFSASDLSESDFNLAQLEGSSILLVDDNVQNLELMQAYLEDLPCVTRTARDGVEAVESIERDPPDLVLLDVMMPRMSGFEVCQKIKSSPRTRDIVVIMVTALHEVGDYERAHECGTDDFLTKPVNKLELLVRVKSLLRVRILKRQLEAIRAKLGLDRRPDGVAPIADG